ncbi:MAG: hypothetical protein JW827_09170 [Spirochaetes bacterium]|nr:hypothetical protein [Spirochaetota bacterium]
MERKIFFEKARLKENRKIGHNFYLLKFITSVNPVVISPGQFVDLRIRDNHDPLLRRPFSIFNYEKGIMSVLYKIQGRGTGMLSSLKKGDMIDYIGPLGNGFHPFKIGKTLSVAGGIGMAGLFYLQKIFNSIPLLIGLNEKSDALALLDLLKESRIQQNRVHIAVMEKTPEFFTGTATDLLQTFLKRTKYDLILSCGPEAMMHSVYKIAVKKNIATQFLLERIMGCGMGVCQGCTVKVKEKGRLNNKLVCKDGPVFSGEEIVWT